MSELNDRDTIFIAVLESGVEQPDRRVLTFVRSLLPPFSGNFSYTVLA
jgi:hypothetical protein